MTNEPLTSKEAIEIILSAQLALDESNNCQAESLMAYLVSRLNETAQIKTFSDKQYQEVFEYYTELNDVQDAWIKKDEPK